MKKLFGNHVLLLTPLTEKGELDEASTRSLVDFVIDKGVHGILGLGSTGEFFTLTAAEKKEFMRIVVEQAADRVPVGFGIGYSGADVAAGLAAYAQEIGTDYVFSAPPYYFANRADGIFDYFKRIGDAVTIPLMVYDGGAGIELPVDMLRRLAAEIPAVKYSKTFIPWPQKVKQIKDALGDKLVPFAGHDGMNYMMLRYGAEGMTTAASNVLPAENSAMFDAIRRALATGDAEADREARRIYNGRMAVMNNIAFCTPNEYPQCYKLCLYWMGVIKSPKTRSPLMPIDKVRETELRAVYEMLKI
jgi:4-hydroxy-tetrahydrodipicolinate synthase